MTSDRIADDDWVDQLALALPDLAKVQEPFLRDYWEQNPCTRVVSDIRRGGIPAFPLDDLRDLYATARHSNAIGEREHYAPLREPLDSVRYILLSHPVLDRVVGPIVGRDSFWMQILNTGGATSSTDLIAGLMARAHELSGDRFWQAANELKGFLDPGVVHGSVHPPGGLDVGYNMMLFYGLTVTQNIDVADGIAILPYEAVRPFLDETLVERLAPGGAGIHRWQSVGAVVKPFRWKPVFSRSGHEPEPMVESAKSFFLDARSFLDLLAVAHESPVLPFAALSCCITWSAARLLGRECPEPGIDWSQILQDLDGFDARPVLEPVAFAEAKLAFDDRDSEQYDKMAPIVSRLAEALARHGRFADQEKVVAVATSLEQMYGPIERGISRNLQSRVSRFLGTDAKSRERFTENVKDFYDARSEIVHGRTSEMSPLRTGAAFVKGFKIAKQSVFKMMRDGPPDDWDAFVGDGQ